MKIFTSPRFVILIAYSYISIIALVLFLLNFYNKNEFFSIGPPISFFGKRIVTKLGFLFIHVLIFFHQLMNGWVNNTVYPWIINVVQDRKNRRVEYSLSSSLILINLFDFYSEVDMIVILSGFTSQISFVFTISIANIIVSTYINYKYLKEKKDNSFSDSDSFLEIV